MTMNMHAQDFLNAFEILRESNEALTNGLSSASDGSSGEKAFGTLPAMGVEVVCLAFSVELHMKYLHSVISKKTPRGHNILALFKALPDWGKRAIIDHPSIAKYAWTDKQFEGELRAISDGFEKWRYAYESNTLRYNSYFALVLIEATKVVASKRNRA
jgi:hypothetical protein